MEPKIGTSHTVSMVVDAAHTARAVGSGAIDVYATPMMIALMEQAATECLAQFLPREQSSVGTRVEVSHDAATPVGMRVSATATITATDRRRVDFIVEASDAAGKIGSGIHSRVIIDKERFLQKTAEKLSK